MSFNPMNTVREFINKSADTASQTFDKVSTDVSKAITPIVQNIKPDIKITQQEPKVPSGLPSSIALSSNDNTKKLFEPIKTQQDGTNELVSFEKQFQSSYVGCFSDDPINPSMNTFLGYVPNISECINMGRENNFEYVGIRGGNECFASNTIPSTQSVDRTKYCNVGCDDIGTGNCGGFFYNQVYKTKPISNDIPKLNDIGEESEQVLMLEATNVLENFISSDTDIKKITMGLNIDNFNCWKPINTYVIFFWLIVLIFLIYLLFEYLYKKNKEKLI